MNKVKSCLLKIYHTVVVAGIGYAAYKLGRYSRQRESIRTDRSKDPKNGTLVDLEKGVDYDTGVASGKKGNKVCS